jgi:hypothetical protein
MGGGIYFGITEEGADEPAVADLQRPLVLAAAVGGDGETVGDDEEALLHAAAEAEAAEPTPVLGERRPSGVPSGVRHVGERLGPRRLEPVRSEDPCGGEGGGVRHVRRQRREDVAVLPEHAVLRGARAAAFADEGRGERRRRRPFSCCRFFYGELMRRHETSPWPGTCSIRRTTGGGEQAHRSGRYVDSPEPDRSPTVSFVFLSWEPESAAHAPDPSVPV